MLCLFVNKCQLTKRMSNIYLKVTIRKPWLSLKLKKFVAMPVFVETKLTQISLNFKTCCNLKIRD